MADQSMEGCTHDCSTCSQNCSSRIEREKGNPHAHVRHVIGIASGKGGVGKSMVSATLAVLLRRRGLKVGLMDADLTGPSIPRMFGLTEGAVGDETGVLPSQTASGIGVMSVNLLLEDPTAPVVWRGPVLSGVIKQLWNDVNWGELDVLLIDLPPGTGDMPLTVMQSLPLTGVVVVTTPQSLVEMVVAKSVTMARMMDVELLGLIENMSGLVCPDCHKLIPVFGPSRLEETSEALGIPALGRQPIRPDIAALADEGHIERLQDSELEGAADVLARLIQG
nr:Mrp/NBP35 family ATP-binding protein [bacterium]